MLKIIPVFFASKKGELSNSLEQLAKLKEDNATEMQQIESYVEQIKCLSDERESLTVEFEKENELLKSQLNGGKTENLAIL